VESPAGAPPRAPTAQPGPSGTKYDYQESRRFFAQVSDGVEELAQAELEGLGATDITPGFRGLSFRADAGALYRAAYLSRTVQRIIAPLKNFDCHSTKYLYQRAMTLPWADFMTPAQTFAISANVSNSRIRHSQYATLCLKDAIVDHFRERSGTRPNVERETPDVRFHLYIHDDRAVIGLEVSGGSLHRRGYRLVGHDAPIQETVAAAIIRLTEWEGRQPLVDPMCGSGTLLCEALMHYCRIPAGYLRTRFGFEALPDFDAAVWTKIRAKARAEIRPLPEGLIRGSDISAEAVAAARANLDQLPFGPTVSLEVMDFRSIPSLGGTTIVSNPPHGIRLHQAEGMEVFCEDLGDFLKQRCQNSQAYLYFGNRELIKRIGLRTTWKKLLSSGGVEGRLIKLVLY
jgi:putative N6-adenine-specific DNA methylase